MKLARRLAALAFVAATTAGSITDVDRSVPIAGTRVLTGDFHVHAMPGDGLLPAWEIQREAARRGLDVVAVTNHNNDLAIKLGARTGLLRPYPIVIPGQELTTRRYHMAAVGVQRLISGRLSASAAILELHGQGGVAIAAHPVKVSWLEEDEEALKLLDGAEVSHPMILGRPEWASQLDLFFDNARRLNPDISPIGSTDFHGGGPLGLCRTYLIVEEVSAAGVLDAIRRGRTVASGPGARLVGADEHVETVKPFVKPLPSQRIGMGATSWIAAAALLALGTLVALDVPYFGGKDGR